MLEPSQAQGDRDATLNGDHMLLRVAPGGLQYLFKACCGRQPGTPEEMKLNVGQLNQYLDQLAGDVENNGKVKVLTQLLQVTTPNQMKWIIQILLKDLKAGHQRTSHLTFVHGRKIVRIAVSSMSSFCGWICKCMLPQKHSLTRLVLTGGFVRGR